VTTNIARFKRKIGSVVKGSIEKVKRLRKRNQNSSNPRFCEKHIDVIEEPVVNEKWTFNFDERKTPLIVCVNSKSGGQKGDEVLRSFYRYLNPLQVYLISSGV